MTPDVPVAAVRDERGPERILFEIHRLESDINSLKSAQFIGFDGVHVYKTQAAGEWDVEFNLTPFQAVVSTYLLLFTASQQAAPFGWFYADMLIDEGNGEPYYLEIPVVEGFGISDDTPRYLIEPWGTQYIGGSFGYLSVADLQQNQIAAWLHITSPPVDHNRSIKLKAYAMSTSPGVFQFGGEDESP